LVPRNDAVLGLSAEHAIPSPSKVSMYMMSRLLCPIHEHLGEVLGSYDWLDDEGVGPGVWDSIRVAATIKYDQKLRPPEIP
jgi:hypothetical protein